ncbi:hypothetical protein M413DRAFT_438279 [Hebeloma cylindrosporum]|uniref:Uncharacterized protein n=1 Tax=Hebeloma cylindrosporum TaxID=76867 RepID=A0A0C3CK92_HEBCY|nr:hypothetical protein M413DRAFT_438279 [Hebeloma cylindrosporum h7]
MSLRIKIPANQQLTEEPMEYQEQPAKRKRKPNRRYLDSDDEKLEAQSKPARSLASGQQPAAEAARAPSFELDIDVLNDPWDDAQLQASDHHSESSAPRAASRTKRKSDADGAPTRKKPRKVVVSEPESEEDYLDTAPDHVIARDDGDDDDYISPDEKTSKSLIGKTKGHSNKSSAVAQGKKRKAPGRPIEHHGPVSSAAPKKKQKLAKLDDPYLDVVGEEPISDISPSVGTISPAVPKPDSPAPTLPPKKAKLPTIKKTKLIGSSSGLNTPTSAIVPVKKPLDLVINAKLSHDGVRKTLMGKTDIDLSNKSIYQEIFLKTGSGGGGTPGRTKEEERRKELNRMRDEAKARRTAEAEHSFDLQAQFDKISRFEDRLRQGRSSVLYPNFMAAKWREVYDKERRKQQEQEWTGGREEGEVT